MQQLLLMPGIVFIIITLITIYIFYRAANKSKTFLIIISVWIIVQCCIALTGFYTHEFTKPPRFVLLLMPPVFCIIILFLTKPGRKFIDNLNIRQLTIIHTIRIFVEAVLYWLFAFKTIPQVMTFAGYNFDVLAGLSAPLVYYIIFIKGRFSKTILIAWNLISFILLLNIIVIAILSLKTPFQQIAFKHPDVALTMFPFILLPCAVVPVILLAHLASLKQLITGKA